MTSVCAVSTSLLLVLEQTPSRRWKTTVRSRGNPSCVYASTHIYEGVEQAKAAAVRIAAYAWGERLNPEELTWRFGPAAENEEVFALTAKAGA